MGNEEVGKKIKKVGEEEEEARTKKKEKKKRNRKRKEKLMGIEEEKGGEGSWFPVFSVEALTKPTKTQKSPHNSVKKIVLFRDSDEDGGIFWGLQKGN